MSSKKIGIVGWNTGENSFGITKPYAEFVKKYGELVILPPMEGIVEGLDLLILPGGKDISPALSGSVPSFKTSDNDVMKEFFFTNNLSKYIEAGVPVFGICLGMQQIAVHFGAKMIQHVELPQSEYRSECINELVLINPENYNWLRERTPDGSKSKFYKFQVNSLHHQVVSGRDFPNELEVIAIEKTCQNIEIIKHRALPIWGVQYHPEELCGYNYQENASHEILTKLLRVNEPAAI